MQIQPIKSKEQMTCMTFPKNQPQLMTTLGYICSYFQIQDEIAGIQFEDSNVVVSYPSAFDKNLRDLLRVVADNQVKRTKASSSSSSKTPSTPKVSCSHVYPSKHKKAGQTCTNFVSKDGSGMCGVHSSNRLQKKKTPSVVQVVDNRVDDDEVDIEDVDDDDHEDITPIAKDHTTEEVTKKKEKFFAEHGVNTKAPATQAPVAPATQAPATQAPAAPATQVPVAPATQAPTTQAPALATQAPASATQAPTTQAPASATQASATQASATQAPVESSSTKKTKHMTSKPIEQIPITVEDKHKASYLEDKLSDDDIFGNDDDDEDSMKVVSKPVEPVKPKRKYTRKEKVPGTGPAAEKKKKKTNTSSQPISRIDGHSSSEDDDDDMDGF
jgi:hypothetical protein